MLRIIIAVVIVSATCSYTNAMAEDEATKKSDLSSIKSSLNGKGFSSGTEITRGLKLLLSAIDSTNSEVTEKWDSAAFMGVLTSHFDVAMKDSDAGFRDKWKLAFTEIAKPELESDFRARMSAFREKVAHAIDFYEFREHGTSNEAISEPDAKIRDEVYRIITTKKGDGDVRYPGLHIKGLPETIRAMVKKFEETDKTSEGDLKLATYEQLLTDKTDSVIAGIEFEADRSKWKAARAAIFELLRAKSAGSVVEYRRLVRNPVRRAFELRLVELEGKLAVVGPVSAGGSVPSSVSPAASGKREKKKDKDKPCCLDVLLGI